MFDVSLSFAFLSSLCFLLFLSSPSLAQNAPLIRSVSGQFLVQDARGAGPSQAATHFGTNSAFVVLDPTLHDEIEDLDAPKKPNKPKK